MKSFTSWDQTEIAYQEWGVAEGSAPPVLLHHGFAANHMSALIDPRFARGAVDFLAVDPSTLAEHE